MNGGARVSFGVVGNAAESEDSYEIQKILRKRKAVHLSLCLGMVGKLRMGLHYINILCDCNCEVKMLKSLCKTFTKRLHSKK